MYILIKSCYSYEIFLVYCFCADDNHTGVALFAFDKDTAEEAGTSVNGGQTVVNPWMTVGGVATTVCQPNEFIM